MRQVACVVEGHGEVGAVPLLCQRVLRLLGAEEWRVQADAIRLPKTLMVGPDGLPASETLDRALRLALARQPAAILVVCDADDHCPAKWGPAVRRIAPGAGAIPVGAVMASREFESWLLWSFEADRRASVRAANPEQGPRDAKGALGRLVPGYAPSTHQAEQVRRLDLGRVWGHSDSFGKFLRTIANLTHTPIPPRPVP